MGNIIVMGVKSNRYMIVQEDDVMSNSFQLNSKAQRSKLSGISAFFKINSPLAFAIM